MCRRRSGRSVMRSAGECVRRRVRARAGEYPTSLVGIKMRYDLHGTSNDRAPAPAPRAARCAACSARQTWLAEHQSGASGTSRLGRPCKLLRLSRLPITMHNVRHMEWRFYSEKPATGGEGVRPVITTATTTHQPPQIFLRQLAPFALAHHRRHATFPYVVQDTSASVFPFWGAR
jgi:hypothetical protein